VQAPPHPHVCDICCGSLHQYERLTFKQEKKSKRYNCSDWCEKSKSEKNNNTRLIQNNKRFFSYYVSKLASKQFQSYLQHSTQSDYERLLKTLRPLKVSQIVFALQCEKVIFQVAFLGGLVFFFE
jgi:hypothetical protein